MSNPSLEPYHMYRTHFIDVSFYLDGVTRIQFNNGHNSLCADLKSCFQLHTTQKHCTACQMLCKMIISTLPPVHHTKYKFISNDSKLRPNMEHHRVTRVRPALTHNSQGHLCLLHDPRTFISRACNICLQCSRDIAFLGHAKRKLPCFVFLTLRLTDLSVEIEEKIQRIV